MHSLLGGARRLHTNTHSSRRLAPPRPPIPPISSLTTRAYHTHARAHFTPQRWLLCNMGLYYLVRVRVGAPLLALRRGAKSYNNPGSYSSRGRGLGEGRGPGGLSPEAVFSKNGPNANMRKQHKNSGAIYAKTCVCLSVCLFFSKVKAATYLYFLIFRKVER